MVQWFRLYASIVGGRGSLVGELSSYMSHNTAKKFLKRYILTLEAKFLLGKKGEERVEKEKFHLYF